jgi:NAD(P)-dependent dehydrogenase (short-subunit alcohol dehydrogenase family)
VTKVLQGKRALITGAGRGIGAAVALAFAREGADLVLSARSRNELDAMADQVRALGVRATVLTCDVGVTKEVDKLGEDALAAFGGLDILISNAAFSGALAPFLDISAEDWNRTQATNLGATVSLLRKVGGQFVKQKSGNVIIMSSIRGTSGVPMGSAYATTKAALNSITKTLAVEWGPARVRVNAILPGPVLTQSVRDALLNNKGLIDYYGDIAPIKGWNMPEAIAEPAVFLASDAARGITGHLLVIDQGLTSILQDAFGTASPEVMEEIMKKG